MALPDALAVDGVVTHDPVTRSLLVKAGGVGGMYSRRGHAALTAAAQSGRYRASRFLWKRLGEDKAVGVCAVLVSQLGRQATRAEIAAR